VLRDGTRIRVNPEGASSHAENVNQPW